MMRRRASIVHTWEDGGEASGGPGHNEIAGVLDVNRHNRDNWKLRHDDGNVCDTELDFYAHEVLQWILVH